MVKIMKQCVERTPALVKAVEVYATLIFLGAARYRIESHAVLKDALHRATGKDIWDTFRPFEDTCIREDFKTSKAAIRHVWKCIDNWVKGQ